ncbi:kinase-like domain-containing protein [Cercophora scortea]|uniref:Kinase-like domain-containing protein n=1 Tax=Cercophora scortea TaxID=314031 RepID=A0AAE0IWY4_9PEZI|nr:kinase-like domain-containing protein [Cercophora scortea]
MDRISPEVEAVLSQIESADMRHPSASILTSYITEALYPVQTARYVKDRLLHDDARSILSDWVYIVQCMQNGHAPPPPDAAAQRSIARRDGGKCCVTGKAGTARDPLIVSPILLIPSGWITDNPRISDMLGVFFGPPYRDWWFSNIKRPEQSSPLSNHWLVRKSAASALAQGLVRLDRQQPSMIEYMTQPVLIGPEDPIEVDGAFPLLGDHSRSKLETVDPRYVGTHSRFSKDFRFVNLAKEIAPEILLPFGQPAASPLNSELPDQQLETYNAHKAPNRPSLLTDLFVGALLTVWLWFPVKARMAVYDKLQAIGQRRYATPYDQVHGVQKLPFNLYLKFGTVAGMTHNEFNALQVVRRHTTVPAPRALDFFTKPDNNSGGTESDGYLLMTGLPGVSLDSCLSILSDRDLAAIAAQMKDYVSQLRGIPNTANPDKPICNTLGEACRDHRIRYGDPIGPFADEAAFSQCLRFSDEDARRGHEIVFTHADLNPRNILVDKVVLADGTKGWRVTGIVDWETAGYYPEYWDYTKAFFERFRWPKRYNDTMHGVFNSFADYSREYDVELRAWESGDGC